MIGDVVDVEGEQIPRVAWVVAELRNEAGQDVGDYGFGQARRRLAAEAEHGVAGGPVGGRVLCLRPPGGAGDAGFGTETFSTPAPTACSVLTGYPIRPA